jgi:hypothetical protein
MSTGQRTGWFWPTIHRQFYSYMIESSEIIDTTNRSSIPTKTQTKLGSLYVVPIAYYCRMKSTDNVHWPNIRLVLANR